MPRLPKPRRTRPKNESWGGDTSFYRKAPWRKMRAYILSLNPAGHGRAQAEAFEKLLDRRRVHMLSSCCGEPVSTAGDLNSWGPSIGSLL